MKTTEVITIPAPVLEVEKNETDNRCQDNHNRKGEKMKKVQKKKMLKLQKKMLKDVVKEYQFVNPQQRSVIIFHNGRRDGCGSSTVVMPEALSSEKEVLQLVGAIAKVVRFDGLCIEPLFTGKPAPVIPYKRPDPITESSDLPF
jgi:hypothetical protein